MSTDNEMTRAEGARDQLARLLFGHTDAGVDIGSEAHPDGSGRRLVLRVHLRSPGQMTELPAEVEGIPVRVVTADYKLE